MCVERNELKAYTSDRQNAFEWEVLIFKGSESIDLLHYYHKPTEEELTEVLKGYENYGKR